jgi:lipopolysaccharide transport system ATP-binding protein
MALEFRDVRLAPLEEFSAVAPPGAIIGLIGEKASGIQELLKLAAGLEKPQSGEVIAGAARQYVAAGDRLNLAPVDVLAIDHALAAHDALVRARTFAGLERMRRNGTTILLASHEEPLLVQFCDEIWWLHEGRIYAKGDPRDTLDRYRRHVAEQVRAWGGKVAPRLAPSGRRGDGRAEILSLETLGADGNPSIVWRSGEQVGVKVVVQFNQAVEKPVLGILIRTRIGFEVYGTNTELEKAEIGSCVPGDVVTIQFQFQCDLCPHDYTLTAASHDPDGETHDWIDDAISFSVTDTRYTAGVANLRAKVQIEKSSAVKA